MIWKGLKYQKYDFSDKYEVSEHGDIRNKNTGTILKPTKNRGGYKFVCLSLNQRLGLGQRKIAVLHKAVAYTFLENTNAFAVVDHKDSNKENNHYSNLEWVSSAENTRRAYENGLFKQPPLNCNVHARLSEADVVEIYELLQKKQLSQKMIAEKYNVSRGLIAQIKGGIIHKNILRGLA